MNGAMAELWAKMMMQPRSSSVKTIGIIHQSLTVQKNDSNYPAIENFMSRLFIGVSSLLDWVLAEDEHVYAAAAESAEGLGRCVHDRLTLEVERCIEQNGN